MVFPLGMYTACTFQLSRALELPFLLVIPRYFIYAALAAWAATFAGLLHQLARELVLVPPAEPRASPGGTCRPF